MINKIKNGFVSIELVIVASIILAVGLAGISAMSVTGRQTVNNGLNRLDSLGMFGEEGEGEGGGTGNEFASGYPSTITVKTADINAESDFTYVWNESLNGWSVETYTNATDKDVIIPALRSDNKPIVSLEQESFLSDGLTSIIMPNSVTQIGASALKGNLLTEVSLPESLIVVGDAAFKDNQLQAVELPNTVTTLGVDSFNNNQIVSVELSTGLTAISSSAFSVNKIASVTLPDGITSIGASAFQDNLITNITVPATVNSLGTSAFRNNRLTSVVFQGSKPTTLGTNIFTENATLPDASVVVPLDQVNSYVASTTSFGLTVPKFANADPNLEDGLRYQWNATLAGWEVYEYVDKTDKSIVIPDTRNGSEPVVSVAANTFKDGGITSLTLSANLKNIGVSAFQNNALTTVTIPGTVTVLGNDAFRTNSLTSVVFNGNKPTTLGTNIFTGNTGLPDGSIWVSSAQLLTYRANASRLGVTEAKIGANPNDANVEGEFVYRWYSGLNGWEVIDYLNKADKTVVIPNTRLDNKPVVAIASRTFNNLGLTSVTLSNNIKSISDDAFNSNNLTSINLPSGLSWVGQYAFANNSITSLALPSTYTSINRFTFFNNDINSLTIPDSVVFVDESAFAQNQLTTLNIGSGINMIGDAAFADNQLASLSLGANITTIGSYAFQNNQLSSVVIPNKVIKINSYAFYNNRLSTVTLPSGLQSIGEMTFATNQIVSINIPSTVITLDSYAFSGNYLESVRFNGALPTTLGVDIFMGNDALGWQEGTFQVPNAYLADYQNAADALGYWAPEQFQGY